MMNNNTTVRPAPASRPMRVKEEWKQVHPRRFSLGRVAPCGLKSHKAICHRRANRKASRPMRVKEVLVIREVRAAEIGESPHAS